MTVKELRDKLALMPHQDALVRVILGDATYVTITDALDGGTWFGVILDFPQKAKQNLQDLYPKL